MVASSATDAAAMRTPPLARRVQVTGDWVRLADVEDRDCREADALFDLERAGLGDGGLALPGARGEDADAGLAFADTAAGINP